MFLFDQKANSLIIDEIISLWHNNLFIDCEGMALYLAYKEAGLSTKYIIYQVTVVFGI